MPPARGHRTARRGGLLRLPSALAAHKATLLPLGGAVVAVDGPALGLLVPAHGEGPRKAKGADPGVVDAAPSRGGARPQGVLKAGGQGGGGP